MLQTRVAPAAAQARAGDAAHRARSSRVAAHALTDLGWTECFLLGALLSPTDPVLSSSVVTNPRVPRLIRHSLNLESGLNDGLALPAVLAFSAALRDRRGRLRVVAASCCRTSRSASRSGSRRAARGALLAARPDDPAAPAVAARARRRVRDLRRRGRLPPEGNGLIAVFVCAIMLGIRRPDMRETFEDARRRHRRDRQARRLRRVRLAAHARRPVRRRLGGRGVVAVTLLVARPVAIWIALLGTRTAGATAGVHGLVRAQGRRDDDVLAARARPRRSPAASGSSTSRRCASSPRSSSTG